MIVVENLLKKVFTLNKVKWFDAYFSLQHLKKFLQDP